MKLLPGMNIAASGLAAQRARLNIVSSNLANAQTTRTVEGGPYKRQLAVFEATGAGGISGVQDPFAVLFEQAGADAAMRGVKIAEITADESKGALVYDPDHPDANAEGLVEMPNVNVVEEMVDMISASRSYEANAQAFQTLREIVDRSLDIGR